ncbi:Zinc knuckle CX2CX4HX4C [Trema orientale]|uniref:Zinc knuckle CX2CX4HX4C n=1 Tax=Trema orientale TaxID=63057 RepID=A0A2P5FZS4_TREOI|nr:Zinc knuckle CX2CX4HX4C [Trema orientale]
MIGDHAGIRINVETDEQGCYIGKFMKIRVLIDIFKPLWRGSRVRVGAGTMVHWVDFKYERLPSSQIPHSKYRNS